ncbi:MAG: hypothetical protein JXB04_08130, partial [Kiritimatiellae bacterium]|nr:hypothetical protein [Kiritimatiellia bacterium]
QRVTFRVAEDGRARRLLREHEPMAGPGAGVVQTNVLLEQVASFRVEAFDGETWVNEWPPEGSGGWPRAARIFLSLAESSSVTGYSTQVWIPVAHVATSRVERVGQRQP